VSRFGKGLKPSTPHKVAHRMGAEAHPAIAAALAAGPKGAADLTPLLPERLDQGQTETCFAGSLAVGIFVALASAGKPLPFVPSPLLFAATTYADVRAAMTLPSQPLPVLQDTGAEFADAAMAAAKWGAAPMGPDVQGRHYDVPDDNGYSFPEPDVSQLQVAGRELIGGEYAITVDASAIDVCCAALDAGIPVWTGGLVGAAYQALTANDIAQPTPTSDPTAGGHAQLLVAYRTNAAGKREFLVAGTWGAEWALNGTVWASEEWVLSQWDLWPLTVAS
jgi:hypothetical protein